MQWNIVGCLFGCLGVAACGRIGFDPGGRAGDALADVPVDVTPLDLGPITVGVAGSDWARAVTLRSDGGFIVVGQVASSVTIAGIPLPAAGNNDIVLISFDPTGAAEWGRLYGTASQNETAAAVTTDTAGNIYMAGTITGPADFGGGPLPNQNDDSFIASFTRGGSYRWAHVIGGPTPGIIGGNDAAFGVIERAGTLVVCGGVTGDVDFGNGITATVGTGRDIYVAAYDSTSGAYQWAHRYGSMAQAGAHGLTASADGYFVTGQYYGTPDLAGTVLPNRGGSDTFIVALDPNGTARWVQSFGSAGDENTTHAAITAAGAIVVVGNVGGPTDFGGGAIGPVGSKTGVAASFAADGSHLWSVALAATGCSRLDGIVQTTDGGFVAVGAFTGSVSSSGGVLTSVGGQDGLIVGLTPDGHTTWAKQFGGATDDQAYGIAGDHVGRLLVTGLVNHIPMDPTCQFGLTGAEEDFYLASY